jgi:Ca2+-binding EF-hand superfamily protein
VFKQLDLVRLKFQELLIDKNNDGKITKTELETFFNKEAHYLCDEQLLKMIDDCDSNKNGVIEYTEFLAHMKSKQKEKIMNNLKIDRAKKE